MTPDDYASTVLTFITLGALALGLLAMLVRALVRHRHTLHTVGQQFVSEVRRGEGISVPSFTPQEGNMRPLALRQWLDVVNHRPDQVPHVFVEGGSGAGKTTLTTAILHDRTDPVAVVGVKPDDGWGEGYVYKSSERGAYLGQLLADVRRRLDENDKTGITIVLDDFTRLTQHKEAVELYKEVADVGRSLRIRLILVARGRQVKGIGAQGESDLLDHFAFLTVARGTHNVMLEIEEEITPLDTREVPRLAQPLPASRWWQTQEVESVSAADDSVLVRLLERTSIGEHGHTGMGGTAGISQSEAIPPNDHELEDTGAIPATLTPEAIRILYNHYQSKNKVAALLTGSKPKRLAIIDAALAAEEAQHAA